MNRNLCLILILFSWICTTAQKSDHFGRLDPSDFDATICPVDSNAHAYYLFDRGNSSFLIIPNGLKIVFERHFRIKILDKSALDEGTFVISLYHGDNNKEEELANLRAITYNKENGVVTETKLEKNSIFKENTSEHIKKVKFTLPNIKEGSILEVKYNLQSDFLFNFQSWTFQHDIPVLESEYITDVPEQLVYNPHFWGYVQVNMSTTTKKSPSYDFSENINVYQAKNIPAFPNEPYITNKDNYRSRIEFELASTRFSSGYEDYTTTWKALNQKLLDNDFFGAQLSKTGYFKDDLIEIKNKNLSLSEKVNAVYNLIRKHIKWNGKEGIYTTGNIRKAYEDGTGNVADINLALISMLRELSVSAYPVLLSTVDNGFILKDFPTLTQLNYVIAVVIDGERRILLDASDPLTTATMLPAKCLNGSGRLINDQEGLWIEIKSTRISQSQVSYQMSLDPEKGLSGLYNEKNYHYAGYKMRSELKDSTGMKEYLDKLEEKFKGLTIHDAKLTGFNENERDLNLDANVISKMGFESTDELIYFNPIQMERLTENPFKAIERKYPVEFEYPWMINAIIEIKLPENYAIESMPKSGVFQNADKSAKFTFVSEALGPDKIKVSSLIYINKARFVVEEYQGIKELFSHIVAKHAEQVVLKKKS